MALLLTVALLVEYRSISRMIRGVLLYCPLDYEPHLGFALSNRQGEWCYSVHLFLDPT